MKEKKKKYKEREREIKCNHGNIKLPNLNGWNRMNRT